MEPKEQLYSPKIIRLWWSGACTSYYEAKEQEIPGRNFVVVNENLHAEFAEFKGKVLSYIGNTHCLIKGIELLKVWSRYPPKPS